MNHFDGIVCVGQTPWEGDFQKAVVQLMTELSVRHRVVYVDYQYTLKDWAMSAARFQPEPELMRTADALTRKVVENGGDVHVWRPPLMLPINFMRARPHDMLLRWNVGRLVKGLRGVMRRLNINRPLVINAMNPVIGVPMLNRLGECATIYYCFDEITISRWMNRHGGRYEPLYLRQVDAVVTTSETLRRTKSMLQPNAYCVKNGVNFDLFNQSRQFAPPDPLAAPVVGYLGTADNRIDLDLVEYCVRTMPDVRFEFVGEVHEPKLTQRLSAYPNVTFVPPRQPAELPALLSRMTAAMIPFVCNAHTRTIYPLKINEYLAAGLPVVSTNFSLLDDFDGVIELADGPSDFADALRRALNDRSPTRLNERIALAKANAWSRRAEEFDVVIDQLQPVGSVGLPPRIH